MENQSIKTFKDLRVWQEGHEIVLRIYNLTKKFPADEKFGLTSQIRRASVSITSNIAEGFGREHKKEKRQFFQTALASLYEVENQIQIAKDIGYLTLSEVEDLEEKIFHVMKMLKVFIKKAQSKIYSKTVIVILFSILYSLFFIPNTVNAGFIFRTTNNLGLVGYWTFNGDDMLTNVADRSGQGNNGNLNGQTSTSTVIGKVGQALDFDGTDDYVAVGNIGSGVGTVSFWIKADDITSRKIIDIDGTDQIEINGSSAIVATSFPAATVYVDGAAASTVTMDWHHVVITDTTGVNASGFDIARVSTGYFDGQIDEVRVYTRALSATEVSKLHQSGKSRRETVSNNGLVGYWKFNEESGTDTTDHSGTGNGGTLTNPSWTDGRLGGAVEFDGTDNKGGVVSAAASINNLGPATISAWIKPSSHTNTDSDLNMYITSKNGTDVWVQNDGTIKTWVVTNSSFRQTISNETVPLNTWTHVLVTYEGGANAPRIYFDGVQATYSLRSAGDGTNTDDSGNDLYIGAEVGNLFGGNFAGALDDIRIYNRVLSDAEIVDLSNSSALKRHSTQDRFLTDGLVGYWSFNGKTMFNNVADSSGTGNTGYLSGQTSTTTAIGKVGQALEFDGSDDYVDAGSDSSLQITGKMAIAMWIKVDDFSDANQTIIGPHNDSVNFQQYGLQIRTANNFTFVRGDGSARDTVSSGALSEDTWYHLVLVDDGTNLLMYIDGSSLTPTSKTVTPTSTFTSLIIGRYGSEDLWYFGGQIDELRMYNRALSPNEVKRLYNMGL